MTFTDVAVLHSGFTWEVVSVFVVTWTFTDWNTDAIVVHDGAFWTGTTLNTLFFAGVFKLESTA
jgi:hypothetical protein